MCLAIPGKLIEIATDGNGVRMGKANFGGIVSTFVWNTRPMWKWANTFWCTSALR